MRKLEELISAAKVAPRKRLVAAYANDSHTIGATSKAIDLGIVDVTLVGDIETMKKVCQQEGIGINKFELVQESNEAKAAAKAVSLINEGKGHILMKGLCSTDKYMKDAFRQTGTLSCVCF